MAPDLANLRPDDKRATLYLGDPAHLPALPAPDPAGAPQSLHHLVPRLKGGARGPTVLLHQLCHKEIHARFTEAELARGFTTIESIRADPRMAGFVGWIARRPPGFDSRVPGPRRRKR